MLPPEVLQLVLRDVPQHDLFRICALSRVFHKEVERALYLHVSLADCTFNQIRAWAYVISSRFDIAQLVCTLSLPSALCPTRAMIDVQKGWLIEFLEMLSQALKAINNLTSLLIVPPRFRNDNTFRSYLSFASFIGCNFRLKTFRNHWDAQWDEVDWFPFLTSTLR